MPDTPQDEDARARDAHQQEHPEELASDGDDVVNGVEAPTHEELLAAMEGDSDGNS